MQDIEDLENSPDDNPARENLEDLRNATPGLREAKQTAADVIPPLLLAEGKDRYFVAQGEEYVAYENYHAAKDMIRTAQEGLDEFNEDKDALEEEYNNAVYEKSRANNAQEYDHASEILLEVEGRYNTLMEKGRTSKETVEGLT